MRNADDIFLSFVDFSDHGLLVRSADFLHRVVEDLIHLLLMVVVSLHVKSDLVIHLWHEGRADGQRVWATKSPKIDKDFHGVSLEEPEEDVNEEDKEELPFRLMSQTDYLKQHQKR